MINNQLKREFPNLVRTEYEITSPETIEYNCIAWAAGETECWWWPDSMDINYWPYGVERKETLESFIEAFETLSYSVCENSDYEEDYEKIAIYVNQEGRPTHAARQLDNGSWTSKLGRSYDISHERDGLSESLAYGNIATVMKRPVQS